MHAMLALLVFADSTRYFPRHFQAQLLLHETLRQFPITVTSCDSGIVHSLVPV
jgi:hypothetical protein